MNKQLLFACCLFYYVNSSAQSQIEYFPQEQLIINDCSDANDKNACLYDFFKAKALQILHSKKSIKLISNLKKDTISVNGFLFLNADGSVKKESSSFSVSNKKLRKKLDSDFSKILTGLPKFKVINKKPKLIKSKHSFFYEFAVTSDDDQIILTHIPNEVKYEGGVIQEIPVFPGCEGLPDRESRMCFQFKIQEHIKQNFRYPVEAQKQNIFGKVYIIFIITKEGKITDIRTRGPHPILEQEARRIVKLLPDIGPGRQNGKAVNVPFSIPITFKL
jgi:TonB family protein